MSSCLWIRCIKSSFMHLSFSEKFNFHSFWFLYLILSGVNRMLNNPTWFLLDYEYFILIARRTVKFPVVKLEFLNFPSSPTLDQEDWEINDWYSCVQFSQHFIVLLKLQQGFQNRLRTLVERSSFQRWILFSLEISWVSLRR